MILLFMIIVASTALTIGIVQGMTHIQPSDYWSGYYRLDNKRDESLLGVRSHIAYPLFHLFVFVERFGALTVGYMIGKYFMDAPLLLISALVMGWELFEVAYSVSRWKKLIPSSENVLGICTLYGYDVQLVHAFRIVGVIFYFAVYIAGLVNGVEIVVVQ